MRPGRVVAAALAIGLAGSGEAADLRDRTFEFTYRLEFTPPASGPVEVFVPLAQTDAHQQVLERRVEASIPGAESTEPREGNRFWHGRVERPDGKPVHVTVRYLVERKVFRGGAAAPARAPSAAELERDLGADRRVPVSGSLVERILRDLPPTDGSTLAKARAIYDYVLANMEYKKVGKGWGQGSTEWACSARYGNCTDFHALFASLARAQGIATRFEIGFPIPEAPARAEIPGYHCWVEIWVPGQGWFPIDASEGWKNPGKRDLFFGTQPADRILFTRGRDLELGHGQKGPPLNYFVFPYVEVAGEPFGDVKTRFDYAERGAADPALGRHPSPARRAL